MAVVDKQVRTKSLRKIQGTVISNKMDMTVVVEASRLVRHPKYGKYYRVYKKYKAHDEKNSCGMGDIVEIIECRPISKDKRFGLLRIVERAKRVELEDAVAV
jgi:small subunit ribosomal protein S17